MVKKYRKKPIVVEAIQYDGKNSADIFSFVDVDGLMTDMLESQLGIIIWKLSRLKGL